MKPPDFKGDGWQVALISIVLAMLLSAIALLTLIRLLLKALP